MTALACDMFCMLLTVTQAARAYDRAAILLRGPTAALNFSLEEYQEDPVLEVSHTL